MDVINKSDIKHNQSAVSCGITVMVLTLSQQTDHIMAAICPLGQRSRQMNM
jgi:hypothetical protein